MRRNLRLTAIGVLILVPIIWIISNYFFTEWSSTVIKSLTLFVAILATVFGFIANLKDVLDMNKEAKEKETLQFELNHSLTTIKQAKNTITLEYRVAILEGMINWMLENESTKNIPSQDMEKIYQDAIKSIRLTYPDVEITIENNRWQND